MGKGLGYLGKKLAGILSCHSGGRRNPGFPRRLDTGFRRCDGEITVLVSFFARVGGEAHRCELPQPIVSLAVDRAESHAKARFA